MKIQGEKFNDAQLFLMSKLEVEVLPKARVILGAYEIAKWMEEYSHPSPAVEKCYPTDEEIRIAGFNHSPTDDRWKGFDEGAKWMRDQLIPKK